MDATKVVVWPRFCDSSPFTLLVVFTAVRFPCLARRSRRFALAALLGVIACVPSMHAVERVTLRNGFSYDCSHHEATDSTHVRLYLSAGAAAQLSTDSAAQPANYIDLPADAIADLEILPDAPPSAAAVADAVAATASPDLRSLLAHAGTLHRIDVELLASVVSAESGGRAAAVSRAGALGLMQLMPGTAAALGVADALRPDQNIAGGAAYLDALLTRYHNNLAFALAAYNAGPAAVDRFGGVPPFRETRAYVVRVMNEFKRRKLALVQTAKNGQH